MENPTEQGELEISDLKTLDNFLTNWDNSENSLYISKVPDACKEYPCCLGIDEAGRGPVLGPMVYGIAFCPINEAALLASLNCDDSKVLKEEQRDKIFEDICRNSQKIGWAIELLSPNKICNNMLSRSKHSLNQVSMDSAIGLIRSAKKNGVKIEHIFVDTVGPPEKYQAYLKSLFPEYKITVAKKADSTYPIVSAASICAKVTRDHALQTWKFKEGHNITHKEFGSGYPGDPVTKKFLADNYDMVFGYPQLVRFSWSTVPKILEEKAYHVEVEEVSDDESKKTPVSNNTITSFFKLSNEDSQKPKKARFDFFTERCLSREVNL
ncbi:ribonuclease H2 subunit A [Coccinella septempunctata]|uniref:ribonuclease H2 subunit A n=1 Tax=Coccinella septempunctata TaxID=41139 RepID=UPI001D0635B0|nr:ribonuclease H2 subunit A [Coccinella septempunctata]XP_044750898.1 ribonuclease H2 subunit A [Coccinella septempunctata]XP_044750906.1 ribonuclease H2 subunit A [Coccinella septempunctata]